MSRPRTHRKLNVESVEARRLMAASPWMDSSPEIELATPQAEISETGVLTVEGTAADEQITVERAGRRQVRVRVTDLATDELKLEQYFPARQVRTVDVNAGAGDDHVVQNTRRPGTVYGGAGDDGLYSRSQSELIGGEGSDRFLMAHSRKSYTSTPVDQGSNEVQIHLHNGQRESVDLGGNRQGQWARGSFAADEVAVLDEVFSQLQERTGNQRLLATARGEELHFYRHGRQLSGDTGIGGWKEGANNIHLTDMSFANDTQARQIVLHEIGHNWDDPEEHDLAGKFRSTSGWQEVFTLACRANHSLSGDGQWTYDAGAQFARDYGRLNPMEDFATSFAGYFLAEDYPGSSANEAKGMNDKLVVLDAMFDDLSQDAEASTPGSATPDPDAGEVHAWGQSGAGWWGDAWRGGW